MRTTTLLCMAACLATSSCSGRAVDPDDPALPSFTDDFESGLHRWLGRQGGHHAEIAADPLKAQNSTVRFWKTVAAGDVFSEPIDVDETATYILEFDYLGVPAPGWNPEKGGGFIGIADGVGATHGWIAGSDPKQATHPLTDDGAWHHYRFSFMPITYFRSSDGKIHLMLEDGEGSVAPRDAYFDNVSLRPAN